MKQVLLYGKPGNGNYSTTRLFFRALMKMNIIDLYEIGDVLNFIDRFKHN